MLDLNSKRLQRRSYDFITIARVALLHADKLVPQWLPDGHRRNREWIARNPRRSDRQRGSFSINLHTGFWSDFATGDAGRDLISLRAYLDATAQLVAARRIAQEMRIWP